MVGKKKIPLRTCVVTREQAPKMEMFRIVRTPEGEVMIDLKGKANGRGVYLKKDKEVILKAAKSKILDRNLECEVKPEIYEELIALLNE